MRTKTLLACGLIGGPLFVFVFLVEGATRPLLVRFLFGAGSSE